MKRNTGKASILVVEDDESLLMVLGKRLSTAGYAVSTIGDATTAVQLVHQAPHPRGLLVDDGRCPLSHCPISGSPVQQRL